MSRLKLNKIVLSLLLIVGVSVFFAADAYGQSVPTADVHMTVEQTLTITGERPNSKDTAFEYVLEAVQAGNPMPEEAKGETLTFSITGNQTVDIGPITFSHGGVYSYKIYQIDAGKQNYTYDTKVYTVTAYVRNRADGGLTAYLVADTGSGQKPAAISFENYYSSSSIGNQPGGTLQTGQMFQYMLFWGIVTVSVFVMLVIIPKRKKNKKNKN